LFVGGKMIDLVVSGSDMSGTSTQVGILIDFFKNLGKRVKDIRGTEIDALFHAGIFKEYNEGYFNLKEYLQDPNVSDEKKKDFIYRANELLFKLKIASMIKNDITTYIDPDIADVWIMEEPAKRGGGQTVRTLEINRSQYGAETDQISASFSYQVSRLDEYFRFRKVLREKDKIIIRSRSEESMCYQVFDNKNLPNGITKSVYIRLPGNKIAFSNPPTHLFIACDPELTKEKYVELKMQRGEGRNLDDFENDADYQILVNKRYCSNWLERVYNETAKKYKSKCPQIFRFNMFLPKDKIKEIVESKMKNILGI